MGIERWYPKGQVQESVSASAWDTLIINRTFLPGRARITKGSAAWKKDKKRKPGADSHRPSYLGFDPRPMGFEILCATTEDADLVTSILAPYIPAPGGKAEPIRIWHPSIAHLRGLKYMVIDEVSPWELQSDHRVKLTASGDAWVGAAKSTRDGKTVRTPTKAAENINVTNARTADAVRRGTLAGANPAPDKQAGFCAPNFSGG